MPKFGLLPVDVSGVEKRAHHFDRHSEMDAEVQFYFLQFFR